MDEFQKPSLLLLLLLNGNSVISKRQFSFMPGRSIAIHHIHLQLVDEWTAAVYDERREIDVIFLEFRKALDTV